ncbi:hypothetical protein HK104_000497 [Borealophlyctis nickersoniae]|nr:hypothetical protein HK104_000497 [Borealophlyctis nickersoniae]
MSKMNRLATRLGALSGCSKQTPSTSSHSCLCLARVLLPPFLTSPDGARPITVKAYREAQAKKAERAAAEERKRNSQPPPLPLHVQRACGLFRRALLDKNIEMALPNYRIIASQHYLHALTISELHELFTILADSQDTIESPELSVIELMRVVYSDMMDRRNPQANIPEDVYGRFIRLYSRIQDTERLTAVWEQMLRDGVVPSLSTYNLALRAFLKHGLLDKVQAVFDLVDSRKDVRPDDDTYLALIRAYAKAGNYDAAIRTFNRVLDLNIKVNKVLVNAVIRAAGKVGNLEGMRDLLDWMRKNHLHPNRTTYDILIAAHARADRVEEAISIFGAMREDAARHSQHPLSNDPPIPSTTTYNILLHMFAKQKDLNEVDKVFAKMLESGVQPDAVTITTLITACLDSDDITRGEKYLGLMDTLKVEPDASVFNAMINLYGGIGDLHKAASMYDLMVERGVAPDRYTFRALILKHGGNADLAGAMRWYNEMRKRRMSADHDTLKALMRYHDLAGSGIKVLREIFVDGVKAGRVSSQLCDQLLSSEIKAGMSVTEAVETVYEQQYRKRGIQPTAQTLQMLVLTALTRRVNGGKGLGNQMSVEGGAGSGAAGGETTKAWTETLLEAANKLEAGKKAEVAGNQGQDVAAERQTVRVPTLAEKAYDRREADALLRVYGDLAATGQSLKPVLQEKFAALMEMLTGDKTVTVQT